jgi:sarcosine oxidase subunit delta
MRITCPLCGERDLREYYYLGASDYLDRPAEGDQEAMHRYLHLRENPAGKTRELWHHEAGCGAWLLGERDATTHEIFGVALASEEQS